MNEINCAFFLVDLRRIARSAGRFTSQTSQKGYCDGRLSIFRRGQPFLNFTGDYNNNRSWSFWENLPSDEPVQDFDFIDDYEDDEQEGLIFVEQKRVYEDKFEAFG